MERFICPKGCRCQIRTWWIPCSVPFLLRPTNCSQFNPFRRAHAYIHTDCGDEHYCIHGKLRNPPPSVSRMLCVLNRKCKRKAGGRERLSKQPPSLFANGKYRGIRGAWMEPLLFPIYRRWDIFFPSSIKLFGKVNIKDPKRECEKGFWMVNWDVAMYIPLNEEIHPKRIDPLHPLIWLLRQQLPFSLQKRTNSFRSVASVTSLQGNRMPLCQKHRKYHTKLFEKILSIWKLIGLFIALGHNVKRIFFWSRFFYSGKSHSSVCKIPFPPMQHRRLLFHFFFFGGGGMGVLDESGEGGGGGITSH